MTRSRAVGVELSVILNLKTTMLVSRLSKAGAVVGRTSGENWAESTPPLPLMPTPLCQSVTLACAIRRELVAPWRLTIPTRKFAVSPGAAPWRANPKMRPYAPGVSMTHPWGVWAGRASPYPLATGVNVSAGEADHQWLTVGWKLMSPSPSGAAVPVYDTRTRTSIESPAWALIDEDQVSAFNPETWYSNRVF